MKSLYESICTISTELNNISIEGIPSKIKDLKYTGDNANFAISIFQEHLINPNTQIKNFLSILAETVFRWADTNLFNGYEKMTTAHHGPELFIGFLPKYTASLSNTFSENCFFVKFRRSSNLEMYSEDEKE